MRVRIGLSSVFAIVMSGVSAAEAQESQKLLWGDVSIAAARVDYDLGSLGDFDGVGQTNAVVLRATRVLSPHVHLEVRGLFAHPREQFGSGWLVMPEAQVQYHWRAGRLEPYVGGGLGAASVRSQGLSDWDPTVSAAVGSAVRVTERLALTGEFRLRGHEWRVTGTTTEFSAGLSWRLGHSEALPLGFRRCDWSWDMTTLAKRHHGSREETAADFRFRQSGQEPRAGSPMPDWCKVQGSGEQFRVQDSRFGQGQGDSRSFVPVTGSEVSKVRSRFKAPDCTSGGDCQMGQRSCRT